MPTVGEVAKVKKTAKRSRSKNEPQKPIAVPSSAVDAVLSTDHVQEMYKFTQVVIEERNKEIEEHLDNIERLKDLIVVAKADIELRKAQAAALKPLLR